MTIPTEGVRGRVRRKRHAYASARNTAVFFLWVILISAHEFGLIFAVHVESGHSVKSPAGRKVRFFDTASFHAPSIPAKVVGTNEDPDTLYGEDKRIIHTGPNPLHN